MSQVITFYSYKGGVGRTMALANVAVLLARWGHKVLVVDWDLEAPGMEHFYKGYIDLDDVKIKPGVVDLLTIEENVAYEDCIIVSNTSLSDQPIHIISSGKRDEDYFKKVRNFNVDEFYVKGGGDVIERLREKWIANYDFVLVDSRTGVTEIGGICTIQLPDIVVSLFTATDHGFEGALDIMKRAGNAQQRLPYDRQKLIFLPIPSRFETTTEFELSQEWLRKFATRLEPYYNDWLPTNIDKKEFLELTKIPYIPYFSFGEKLPVIEQGVKDPSGLGYAFENLALLLASGLDGIDRFLNERLTAIERVNKNKLSNSSLEDKFRKLKQDLNLDKDFDRTTGVINCIQSVFIPIYNKLLLHLPAFDDFFQTSKKNLSVGTNDNRSFEILITDSELLRKEIIVHASVMRNIMFQVTFTGLKNHNNPQSSEYLNFQINFRETLYTVTGSGLNMKKTYNEYISEAILQNAADSIVDSTLESIRHMANR